MFGTRQFFANAHNYLSEIQESDSITALLVKGKKISQIIAYIWANDNETSQQLDKYFKVPASSTNPLSSLLFAQEGDLQYKLLEEVFKEHPDALPIFDKSETKLYNFQVTYNRFEGVLTDPTPGEDTAITMIIPYPPRPQIYDDLVLPPPPVDPLAKNAPLKASELKAWLEEDPNIPPYYYQENPYIPTTCC